MEVPVHNMGMMLPALAQWDILEICVKVSNVTANLRLFIALLDI